MKILLTTLNTKYVHTNIALKYLYKTLENKEVTLKEYTINEPLGNILRDMVTHNADVIAFSVYIWNVEEVLKLSQNIKKIIPDVKIILGGPEVTYRSAQILKENSSVDYIVVGEGEEVLPTLIEALEQNVSLENLKNVSYRKSEDEIAEGEIAITCDTNNITRIAEEIVKDYDGKIVYIETVRGCPYNCSYCLSSTIKGIRPFDTRFCSCF